MDKVALSGSAFGTALRGSAGSLVKSFKTARTMASNGNYSGAVSHFARNALTGDGALATATGAAALGVGSFVGNKVASQYEICKEAAEVAAIAEKVEAGKKILDNKAKNLMSRVSLPAKAAIGAGIIGAGIGVGVMKSKVNNEAKEEVKRLSMGKLASATLAAEIIRAKRDA